MADECGAKRIREQNGIRNEGKASFSVWCPGVACICYHVHREGFILYGTPTVHLSLSLSLFSFSMFQLLCLSTSFFLSSFFLPFLFSFPVFARACDHPDGLSANVRPRSTPFRHVRVFVCKERRWGTPQRNSQKVQGTPTRVLKSNYFLPGRRWFERALRCTANGHATQDFPITIPLNVSWAGATSFHLVMF